MRISVENLQRARKLTRNALPRGWKLLGRGSSRTAFLGPDGLVYKVPSGDTYQNAAEGQAVWLWRKRTDLPEWLIIPRAHFDSETGVLVMEYHEGSQPRCAGWDGCSCGQAVCWVEKLRDAAKLGWCDQQTANALLTPDGKVVLVDMGCN